MSNFDIIINLTVVIDPDNGTVDLTRVTNALHWLLGNRIDDMDISTNTRTPYQYEIIGTITDTSVVAGIFEVLSDESIYLTIGDRNMVGDNVRLVGIEDVEVKLNRHVSEE